MAITRPTIAPEFATDTLYPAGASPWSGQPNKVTPAGIIATGFIPDTFMASDHMNYELSNYGNWLKYLDSAGRRSFINATWMTVTGSGAAFQCGGFNTVATGTAGISFVDGGATYDAPTALVTVAGAGDAMYIAAQKGVQFPTFFAGEYTADIGMSSALAANALNLTAGLASAVPLGATPTCAAFEVLTTEANWFCVTGTGAARTRTDSGVAKTTAVVSLVVRIYGATFDTGGLRVEFYINGTLVATTTTNIGQTTAEFPLVNIISTAGTANTVSVGNVAFAWSRRSAY